MASTSSSHQQDAFSGIEPPCKRRKIEESTSVYDVFINHRGPDVKLTLATELYKSLKDVDIKAFLDSEEKERGVSIISTIETAIRSASVHIAIFSTKYAESDWCLRELVLMLQTKAKIIPVFYQVEPWELRHIEKGVYADAFHQHQEKSRYLDNIAQWKEALQQVSYIAGDVFTNPDSRDCKDIVSAVEKEVQRKKQLYVAKYPVGLDKLVRDFERLCLGQIVQDFESQCRMKKAVKGKANIVGIFGMGGVGKTTLSKELFNQKRSNYTRASFLFDVREACARGELPSLQSRLLKDIFGEDKKFESSEEGTSFLRDRLERSSPFSSLIVLDDIDHVKQLDALLIMNILNKSDNNLVIITTRNVGVLVSAGIDIVYSLKGLDREDGRELFCRHVFDQPLPLGGFEDLVENFVNVCGGLPLSLIVLGRHVSGRCQRYWQDELEKVKEALPGDIKQSLKISTDTLDHVETQIFMDIACFFNGKSVSKALTIWKGSGWRARRALETLKEKCLVEEVHEMYLNLPEYEWEYTVHGSALRMHDHLRDLGREMADEQTYPRRVWRPHDLKSLESKGFRNILSQAKIRCFHSIEDKSIGCEITYFLAESITKYGSDASLLWLQLEYLNSDINSSIFSWIPLQNLQCLRIGNGCFKKLWQSDVQAPTHLEELQILDTSLEDFPDLVGKLNNIKKLGLHAKDIQMDIWSLLESLRMNLHSLSMLGSDLVGHLAYNDTSEGTAFKSVIIYDFKHLWEAQVAFNNGRWCRTVMSDLGNLEISGCPELEELTLTYLSCLETITIVDCVHLNTMSGIANLAKLVELKISGCDMLEFERLCLRGMEYLQRITVDRYAKMEYFELDSCENLRTVMISCKYMVKLSIRNCPELDKLADLTGPSYLKRIIIDGCGSLKYLTLMGLENLESLSGGLGFKKLLICQCDVLEELTSLFRSSCLEEIQIIHCHKLHNIALPAKLTSLIVEGCRNLQKITGIYDLTELTELDIVECPKLDDLMGIEKHFCPKNGFQRNAMQLDWEYDDRKYRCDCGTTLPGRDSFITHLVFCNELPEESVKTLYFFHWKKYLIRSFPPRFKMR